MTQSININDSSQPWELAILGASNVSRGLDAIASAALCLRGPVILRVVAGRGRSFGMNSALLGRQIPGILQSGFWKELDRRSSPKPVQTRRAALITDIGNDIFYGVPADQIVLWVEDCVSRLERHGYDVSMSNIPVERIHISEAQWKWLQLMVPAVKGQSFSRLKEVARTLHRRLDEVICRRGIGEISIQPDWYGLDPIHYKSRAWPAVWSHMMSVMTSTKPPLSYRRLRPLRWLQLQTLGLEGRTVWGIKAEGRRRLRLGRDFVLENY